MWKQTTNEYSTLGCIYIFDLWRKENIRNFPPQIQVVFLLPTGFYSVVEDLNTTLGEDCGRHFVEIKSRNLTIELR